MAWQRVSPRGAAEATRGRLHVVYTPPAYYGPDPMHHSFKAPVERDPCAR